MKRRIVLPGLMLGCLLGASAQTHRDTTYMSYPEDCTMKVHLRHDYSQTLTTKLFLCQSHRDGRYKHADNGKKTIKVNFEQAAERIAALDNITQGMPKIVYLVGWQYNGHDSKYPAVFEGNEALKRPQDKDALESIRWVMAEGKKHHTAVSLHINVFDVYEDSPWFMKCIQADVLARTKAGFLRGSEWGYKMDYVQFWNNGVAKELIDSLCTLLPVQEAGTIHIDAFHTALPEPVERENGEWGVQFDTTISPYHGWDIKDEINAQLEIIKYWDQKGVDVTTEGLDGAVDGDQDPHIGYRPMVWHYDCNFFTRYPASMLTGGDTWDPMVIKLIGNNESLEPLLQETPCDYKAVTRSFCTSTLQYNFLNHHERVRYIHGENYGRVEYTDNLFTEVDNGHFLMVKDGCTLAENNDMLIPALWMDGKQLIAYSTDGYKSRTWNLLPNYPAKGKVSVYSVDENGKKLIKTTSYSNRKLRLTQKAGEMLLIELQ